MWRFSFSFGSHFGFSFDFNPSFSFSFSCSFSCLFFFGCSFRSNSTVSNNLCVSYSFVFSSSFEFSSKDFAHHLPEGCVGATAQGHCHPEVHEHGGEAGIEFNPKLVELTFFCCSVVVAEDTRPNILLSDYYPSFVRGYPRKT
jgi:hypothetical protein